MPKIQVLPDSVARKIAAGEVIERPASVVKELVENSLDAGARRVVVEIDQGGRTRIAVTDDGEGMAREDATVAFEPHGKSPQCATTGNEVQFDNFNPVKDRNYCFTDGHVEYISSK